MNIKITYPPKAHNKLAQQDILKYAKWPFMFAAYICPILNIAAGGPAWSIVVLWSLYFAWSMLFSVDLVEYNRISQVIKFITDSAILLIIIDVFLSPGWAASVVPIVCFSGLIVAAVLFFTDYDKQAQNMLPMLILSVISLIASVLILIFMHDDAVWEPVVMGAIALALICACCIVAVGRIKKELAKFFHTK